MRSTSPGPDIVRQTRKQSQSYDSSEICSALSVRTTSALQTPPAVACTDSCSCHNGLTSSPNHIITCMCVHHQNPSYVPAQLRCSLITPKHNNDVSPVTAFDHQLRCTLFPTRSGINLGPNRNKRLSQFNLSLSLSRVFPFSARQSTSTSLSPTRTRLSIQHNLPV
jgi:hypothetical protein